MEEVKLFYRVFLNELKKSESMFLVLVGGGLVERCNIMCFVVLEIC